MALFKILRGQKANLPSTKTDGRIYITEDTGEIYFDTSNSKRIQLNANNALSADKVNKSLTVQGNGTNAFTFDGSTSKTLNIKPGTAISVTSDTSGNITIGSTQGNATTSAAGLMSASDKTKLNGIATGATKITVDSALSSTSTNPVQNKVINSALAGKANSSHGNHVPATQTANNAVFLRNDNTWQTVTPANIGAAASSHSHSNYVPTSRTVNGKALSANISLTYSDVGAAASSHSHSYLPLSGGTVTGATTFTGGAKISGRYTGGGDDEGLVIGRADNNYAGLCLGEPSGVRSVMYLMPDNSAVWRYNNDSTTYDIKHPGKAGTIALTSDIPTNYVPTSRTVNGKALSSNVSLTYSDVGAAASSHNQGASTITAGTFAGQVVANSSGQAYNASVLRNTKLVTSDTNPSVNGEINWTYK